MTTFLDPVQAVLDRLQGVKPSGQAQWSALCPAHDDRHASLSVSCGDGGRCLIHCHAGCTPEAICCAIGLEAKDLFAADPKPNAKPVAKIVASYNYVDAAGTLLYQVVRFEPKDFRQRRPDGQGGWTWKTRGVQRVLYRLPELLAADPTAWVFVVEGEKDADALAALGLVATCNPGGAGKWMDEYTQALRSRLVVVVPDRDNVGWTHAEDVARRLSGAAATVRILDLGQVAGFGGKDVSDWIEWRDSSTAEELASALVGMAEAAPDHRPGTPATTKFAAEWQPFPVEMLPPVCRRFVKEAAAALGVDASYVALPLLAGLAAAIGNTRRIALSRTWTAPAVLWALIVGESGMLKTPAMKAALMAVTKRQARAMEAYKAAMARYGKEMDAHRLAVKDWKKDGRMAGQDAPAEPDRPRMERLCCSDITVEALAERLEDTPRGLLVMRDELSAWLGSFGQYKQGKGRDEANWLSMFDAGNLMVDRKTGDKKVIHVPRAAVCITGGIQPGILQRMFTAEHYESGLAARFLMAMPPRRAKRWTGCDISQAAEEQLGNVFATLWGLAPVRSDDGEARPLNLPLTDEARPVWAAFVNSHGEETADALGPVAAAFSKLEGYAARLALVLALARWAEDPGALGIGPAAVDLESLRAGIAIVEWAKRETRRIYIVLSENDEERQQREVLELVERRGGAITVRQLQQSGWHGLNADQAEELLASIVADGLGRWVDDPPGPKGGRPTRHFEMLQRNLAAMVSCSNETSENHREVGV